MIAYEHGDYHLCFIWQWNGSTLPKAALFALPSTVFSLACLHFVKMHIEDPSIWGPQATFIWSMTFFTLSMLIGFRCNIAYKRFWEGCQLVQAMSAEWFESCSNLIAFSLMPLQQHPDDKVKEEEVISFQFRLIHLMSLLHAMALRQVGGRDGEDIEVLDINGLDERSMEYLTETCSENETNRVEVILHWIQLLITESIHKGVLITPPPILTRTYQTLSRGMVHLHSVRRIADVPFPFPLAQATVVFLIMHSIFTPVVISFYLPNYVSCAMVTFLPIFGCWNIVFVCGEMENPFGTDANDLPLSMQQFEFHTSLMMLVDQKSMHVPQLRDDAAKSFQDLRDRFGSACSTTAVLFPESWKETNTVREALRGGKVRNVIFDQDVDGGDSETVASAGQAGVPIMRTSVKLGVKALKAGTAVFDEGGKSTEMMKLVKRNSVAPVVLADRSTAAHRRESFSRGATEESIITPVSKSSDQRHLMEYPVRDRRSESANEDAIPVNVRELANGEANGMAAPNGTFVPLDPELHLQSMLNPKRPLDSECLKVLDEASMREEDNTDEPWETPSQPSPPKAVRTLHPPSLNLKPFSRRSQCNVATEPYATPNLIVMPAPQDPVTTSL